MLHTPSAARDEALSYSMAPRLTMDASRFDPMRVLPVTHNLEHHPLLQLPALVDVAQRLSGICNIRYHDDRASFGTSFVDAPTSNPVGGRPEDIVRSIESAHAWLAMLNVHHDPQYRQLMDDVLGSVASIVERADSKMAYRGTDIFIASPGAVTPYHMDHNNNFILQVRGNKLLYVCEPLDRDVVTESSLELFHSTGSRDLVVYREEFLEKANTFDLQPGEGAYMPTTAPHWVKNGDNVSITISFTFYTAELRRRKLLHRGNYYLRRMGLNPSAVGQHESVDALKHGALRATFGARDGLKRVLGQQVEDTTQLYIGN
jgi:hypothetical protein